MVGICTVTTFLDLVLQVLPCTASWPSTGWEISNNAVPEGACFRANNLVVTAADYLLPVEEERSGTPWFWVKKAALQCVSLQVFRIWLIMTIVRFHLLRGAEGKKYT